MNEKPNLGAGSVTIDVRGLPEGEHPFRTEAARPVLVVEGETQSAFRDARIEGSLKRHDSFVRLQGTLRGVLESTCDRCLGRFERPVETEMALRIVFGESPAGELESETGVGAERDETFVGSSDEPIDLSDALREAVLLELPIKNLCREDCRGICPRCGANRNLDPCACETAPRDSRWSALREISFPTDDQE